MMQYKINIRYFRDIGKMYMHVYKIL